MNPIIDPLRIEEQWKKRKPESAEGKGLNAVAEKERFDSGQSRKRKLPYFL